MFRYPVNHYQLSTKKIGAGAPKINSLGMADNLDRRSPCSRRPRSRADALNWPDDRRVHADPTRRSLAGVPATTTLGLRSANA
jgi:hypothetical protein